MAAIANLVHETSTSTGTGNLTLAAVNGKQRASTAFGTGDNGADNPVMFISNRSAAEWEVVPCYMSDADTLVRGTPLESSNSNAAVNFSAGIKDVCANVPAQYQIYAEGTPAQGDIIYRGASGWTRLAPGTSGYFLKTQGAAANPAWAALPTPGLVYLNSGSVSSAATLDIVLTSYTGYRGFTLRFANFRPASDGVKLAARVSTNGGTSYDSSSGNYKYANACTYAGGSGSSGVASNSATEIQIGDNIGNDANRGLTGTFELHRPDLTGAYPTLMWHCVMYNANDDFTSAVGGGMRLAAQDTDALRFFFASGNITSGEWSLYGYS